MAYSVPATLFRPTVPQSSNQAFLESAMSVVEVKALLEGHNRNEQLMALGFIYGGPSSPDIAPFARAFNEIRENWLRLNGRSEVLQTFLYLKLADVIELNNQQRSRLDFLAHCPWQESTARHIVRTVSAIRVCSDLVQYEQFDSAWRCAMESDESDHAFAGKLDAARLDYVGDRMGMDKSNAQAEFRGAVALQLREGVSPPLQERCPFVMDIDRKLTTLCASIHGTQHVLKALDHTWGGDSEPPFDFIFSFRQVMNTDADGDSSASSLRLALRRHLVAALPAPFQADYELAMRIQDEAGRKMAVQKLAKEWLGDPALWPHH
jgi:hypothetical protein